jgi:hypothetical protein
LLEPIECLMELVDLVRELRIFKAQWLFNIDLFGDWAIQESTLDIHLM